MTKEEFIKDCVSLGYSSKKIAAEYAEAKNGELSDDDFIEVFRFAERKRQLRKGDVNEKWRNYQGTRSTKFLPKYSGSVD